jgi:hypothetical protein
MSWLLRAFIPPSLPPPPPPIVTPAIPADGCATEAERLERRLMEKIHRGERGDMEYELLMKKWIDLGK